MVTNEEIALRLQEIGDRTRSNVYRIEKLEQSTEAINRLATNMEIMVVKQERVADTVEKLDGKVTALESKPAKRWENVTEKMLLTVVAALVGFVLAHFGL